jgi:nucleotide-binding universal stress UspA family protein
MLQKFCAKTNNANINTDFIQKVGSLVSIICNLAKEWNADLIIMGLQGLFGIRELLISSASTLVLHNASYSVYTIYLVYTVKSRK